MPTVVLHEVEQHLLGWLLCTVKKTELKFCRWKLVFGSCQSGIKLEQCEKTGKEMLLPPVYLDGT